MNQIEQLRANVRQTAVDAERHWWVTRLELLLEGWKQDEANQSSIWNASKRHATWHIEKLIAERSK